MNLQHETLMTIQAEEGELTQACERLWRGEFDQEETRVLTYLQQKHPQWVTSFQSRIPQARASILRRLVESILREDVLQILSRGRIVRERDRDALHLFLHAAPCDEWLVIPMGQTFAFRRIEGDGELTHHRPSQAVRGLTHPVELLQFLHRMEMADTNQSSRHEWLRLGRELQNGTANLALALVFAEERRGRLRLVADQVGVATSLGLVEHMLGMRQQNDEGAAGFDAALFFEQLCVEGHNLHPCAKTKMGMEARDVVLYGPEFEGRPQVGWVAVRRDWAGWSYEGATADLNAALFTELPAVWEHVRCAMRRLGLEESEFLAVALHPWQLEHVLPELYSQELASRIVVPLPGVGTPSAATSAFRTLVTDQGDRRLAIKVAVNSQMTSTVRSISTNTANNGPRFTRLIRDVMRREPHLAATFVPVCELAGFYFLPAGDETNAEVRNLKSRNLTSVWREDVSQHVRDGELAIVGTAYYAESPISGRTVLEELVEAYANYSAESTSLPQAAHRFLSEYAEVAIPGFLTLMVKYGIALEGHLQNSVGVFRNGRPVKLLFRDWGGVRVCRERLSHQGLTVELAANSVVLTEDVAQMQNKLFYTFYQNHLAEMILILCKRFGLAEGDLWREVREISDCVFAGFLADPATQSNARDDREALFRRHVQHKALTSMRLATDEAGYCYATVANPLFEEQRCRGNAARRWASRRPYQTLQCLS